MFDILDTKQTNELYLVRKGWFSPEYELTDKVRRYGTIVYHRLTRRRATVTTATDEWTFERGNLFTRSVVISNKDGERIGVVTAEWFCTKWTLTLNTGLKAEFYRPSIWSKQNVWDSVGYGQVMQITSNPFSLTNNVHINQSMIPAASVPLLTFLGSYIIILRRRRKAVH